MPNWCENELTVRGNKADIRKLKTEARGKDTDLSLNNLYPMPEELGKIKSPSNKSKKALVKKYGADHWFYWRLNNWGTKWDVTAELTDETDESLLYDFCTAWSPPIPWLNKVAMDYPELSFRLKYDEPGMGFAGVTVAEKGEVKNRYSRIRTPDRGDDD